MKISDDARSIWIGDREVQEIRLGSEVIWRRGQNAPACMRINEEESDAWKTIRKD